ncbi:sensor histidine kinase [Frigoriflavimonas asaccharolytica]|uniref:YXYXY domain-containing protein n=1 Tax=Frigoriflavimonas asaccharolytica TaxID=2735899 RepID=A0A8J8G4S5_9FLAO|nr:histidine kinase [Frigoriflavimonas asaccharolytica]NRS91286.1 hypothetical protein [Frigoriflavimonas asaccharolytica]
MLFQNGIAQEPVSIQFTQKDGLPDKEFYRIAEDKTGLIWLAGNKGLTKYDGNEFSTLENSEKRGFSVFELTVDDDDRKWCINISGQLFYAVNDHLILYKDFKKDLKGNLAELIYHDGFLVVSTYFIIITIDIKDNIIRKFPNETLYFSRPSIINKQIVFWTHRQRFIIKNGIIVGANKHQFPKSKSNDLIREIPLEGNKNLFVYLINGKITNAYLFDNKKFLKIDVPKEILATSINLIKTEGNSVWFLCKNGAFQTSFSSGKLSIANHYFKNEIITDFIIDSDGNSWFSSLDKGVYVLPNTKITDVAYDEKLGEPLKILKGKENDLLVGFSSGKLLIYNTLSLEKTIVNLPKENRVSAVSYDRFGDRYLVFQDIKLFQVSTKKPFNFTEIPNESVAMKQVEFFSEKEYLFSQFTRSGISKVENFPKITASSFQKIKRGYACHYNPISKLSFFGFVDELVIFDHDKNQNYTVKTVAGKDLFAHSILHTNDGFTWIATFSKGIFRIKNKRIVAHFTTKNGLLSDRVNALATDNNTIWIATEKGIQIGKLNNRKLEFTNLFTQDGVPSYNISDMAVVGNSVYFSSPERIFAIEKNFEKSALKRAKIYFTSIKINQENQKISSNYLLENRNSNVVIQFNVNGLGGISGNQFEYRLKGLNEKWTLLDIGKREVQFANLPSGNFTFQLRSVSNRNDAEHLKEIKFEVTKEFYESVWFWIAVSILLLLLVYLYFKRKIKLEKQVSEEEKAKLFLDNQLINLKLENLQSQMNPHFIFNALNSIQEYIVHNKKELASSYLVKFSRLIRLYLDQSRENSVSLEQELMAMKLYLELEKVRFEDKLEYTLKINCEIKASEIYLPPLFIQPYVENAFKHGLLHRKTDRKLLVEFHYDESTKILSICIEDNGIGRIAAQKLKFARPNYHTSFATSANEKRVALINENRAQKISVEIIDVTENGMASGTRVCVQVPQ